MNGSGERYWCSTDRRGQPTRLHLGSEQHFLLQIPFPVFHSIHRIMPQMMSHVCKLFVKPGSQQFYWPQISRGAIELNVA